MQYLEIITEALSLTMIALSLVFTLGIIWRVEKKLDLAYKIFFTALVFLLISKIADLFVDNQIILIINQISNFLFALLLLAGVWEMRNLFRDIDGEKEEEN